MTDGRWPMADGRWPMADGRWPRYATLRAMEYRRLGSTGLKISWLALGCGNFGGMGFRRPSSSGWETTSGGVRVDGPRVGRGDQFLRHGRRLWRRPQRGVHRTMAQAKGFAARERLLLSSKVFNPVGPGPNDRGLSRRHILRQVDASLTRLQTDRLDMYLIHEPDPDTPIEETMEALDDLVRAGKVLYVGASNIEAWRLARALCDQRRTRAGPLRLGAELLQPPRPQAGARDVPALRRSRVGFTAFSPLAGDG